MSKCEQCAGTGYYGDNGPGVEGNAEYHLCEACVLTTGKGNRQYKLCKCNKCGTVGQCTPNRDFYTVSNDDDGPLYCESCFRVAYSEQRARKPVDNRTNQTEP